MLMDLLGRLFFIIPPLPRTAQLAVTNRCNFDCAMCQRHDLKVDLVDMDFDVYRQILLRLRGVKNLILTSWGEPLMHPRFIEMLQLGHDQGFKVRFTTNGVLLNEEKSRAILETGIEAVTFSLDQINNHDGALGHTISSQLDNIIRFKKLINQQQAGIKIFIQATYHAGGDRDIIDVMHFAIAHKLDRLRLSRLDVRFRKFDRPTVADEKKLIKKLEQLSAGRIGIDFLPHTAFDGWRKTLFRLISPWLHRGGKYCLRTYEDIYIDATGLVTPCCGLPWLSMGNILKKDLREIWRGSTFSHFRANQRGQCGLCDVLAIKLN